MKNTKTLLALLAGSLLATAGHAQVEVTVTGSTAFRSITIDRAASLYDAGSRTSVTNDASTGLITFNGTISNRVASLGSTPVKIRLSFSGSGSGMLAVKNSTPVSTAETQGVNVNKVPDLALSDVFPGSATRSGVTNTSSTAPAASAPIRSPSATPSSRPSRIPPIKAPPFMPTTS